MQFILFLSLARKKKIPKRKEHSCTSGTTSDDSRAKRQELATLRQPAFYTPENRPPLHAPTVRPDLPADGNRPPQI